MTSITLGGGQNPDKNKGDNVQFLNSKTYLEANFRDNDFEKLRHSLAICRRSVEREIRSFDLNINCSLKILRS